MLVDDHAIVRAGLVSLLGRDPGIEVVATAATGEEALELVDACHPDVAVVDYRLPGIGGAEVCVALGVRRPPVPVVMLSHSFEDAVVEAALRAGAVAFVHKEVDGRGLRHAVRLAARGESAGDPEVGGRVVAWAGGQGRRSGPEGLSQREADVLRLAAAGLSNPRVATALGISEHSVKTYLQRAYAKLGCRGRAEAAGIAARHGLL